MRGLLEPLPGSELSSRLLPFLQCQDERAAGRQPLPDTGRLRLAQADVSSALMAPTKGAGNPACAHASAGSAPNHFACRSHPRSSNGLI